MSSELSNEELIAEAVQTHYPVALAEWIRVTCKGDTKKLQFVTWRLQTDEEFCLATTMCIIEACKKKASLA